MDLFSRYVFRQAGSAIAMILVTLTLLVWIATALKQMEMMSGQGQGFWLFIKMTTLVLPSILVIIVPVAFIIASIHTLNRLNTDSELIILAASGSSAWRIAIPFFFLSCLVTAFLILGNVYLQPESLRTMKSYIVKIRTDMVSSVLQPGQFSRAEKGLTFHIRDRRADGELLGLLVHDNRNSKESMTFMAKRAQVVKNEGKVFLVMFEGHVNRHRTGDENVEVVAFDQYMINLSTLDKKKSTVSYRAKESYISELWSPSRSNPHFRNKPGKFRSELHERLSNPLYPTLYMLVIIAFLGQARTTRHGRTNAVIMAFAVSVGFRILGLVATNMTRSKEWAVPLPYIIPLCGILFAIILIHSRTRTPRVSGSAQPA